MHSHAHTLLLNPLSVCLPLPSVCVCCGVRERRYDDFMCFLFLFSSVFPFVLHFRTEHDRHNTNQRQRIFALDVASRISPSFLSFSNKIMRNEFSNLNDFTHIRKWVNYHSNERHDKFFLFISVICLPKRSRIVIRFSFDCFIRQIQELGGNARQLIFMINIDINII